MCQVGTPDPTERVFSFRRAGLSRDKRSFNSVLIFKRETQPRSENFFVEFAQNEICLCFTAQFGQLRTVVASCLFVASVKRDKRGGARREERRRTSAQSPRKPIRPHRNRMEAKSELILWTTTRRQ